MVDVSVASSVIGADAIGATAEVLPPSAPRRPVVVHVPHASRVVPTDVRQGIVLEDAALEEELRRITDHRTDVLAADVGAHGALRFVNRRSRLVVDPERLPDDREEMRTVGMGAVYTRTTMGERLRAPDAGRDQMLLARYFVPYAHALQELVGAFVDERGGALIVDLHSYPSRRLPYELHGEARRPEVCIGTHPVHTPARVRERVEEVAAAHGLSTDVDTVFRGTYVPERWYGLDPRVRSVMLELRRDTYLEERTATPHAGETAVRTFVTDVVATLADDLERDLGAA